MKINKLLALSFAALAMCTTSCLDDDDAPKGDEAFLAFVTFSNSTAEGSTFTTYAEGDNNFVTLTSNYELDTDDYPLGKRYIISYTNASGIRFQSGAITLYGIYNVLNGSVESAPIEEITSLQTDVYYPTLIERSGTYINIEASAEMSEQPQIFNLYVDEATIDSDIPQVYLCFKTDHAAGSMLTMYASLDLSSVWTRSTCKGICLHYYKSGILTSQTFSKQTITPID